MATAQCTKKKKKKVCGNSYAKTDTEKTFQDFLRYFNGHC